MLVKNTTPHQGGPAAAAAEEQAAGTTAFAQLRTVLLRFPWRERAGYLDKTLASQPDALAALHSRFADLTAGPMAAIAKAAAAETAAREAAEAAAQTEELRAQICFARAQLQPSAPDTGAAAAAEAAAKSIEDLHAQLAAQQAETDATKFAPLAPRAKEISGRIQLAKWIKEPTTDK